MKNILYSAIIGDVIGSRYEGRSKKAETIDFQLFQEDSHFTDDTVCTIAIADWLINGGDVRSYLRRWARNYPHAGYGKTFKKWFMEDETNEKMDSWGNGSAMRVSPVAWVSESLEETLELARQSAEWTHNHEEGIKGAQATAACIWLARHGKTKDEIKEYIESNFGYDLSRTFNDLLGKYSFSSWCQTSVPESIICFLESDSYGNAIRRCVLLNGDTDTMAAIAGSMAAPFYEGIPEFMVNIVKNRLPKDMVAVIEQFDKKFAK